MENSKGKKRKKASILLWILGAGDCQAHFSVCDCCVVPFIFIFYFKMLQFRRILKGLYFTFYPTKSLYIISEGPSGGFPHLKDGEIDAEPLLHIEPPETGGDISQQLWELAKHLLELKIFLQMVLLAPDSKTTEQRFPIYSKMCFVRIWTTIKSERALRLIVCHNINWQQFFLVLNKIMMPLITSAISDATKHIR